MTTKAQLAEILSHAAEIERAARKLATPHALKALQDAGALDATVALSEIRNSAAVIRGILAPAEVSKPGEPFYAQIRRKDGPRVRELIERGKKALRED